MTMPTPQENHDDLKKAIEELREDIRGILVTLTPIAETYSAVSKLGTWAKYGLGVIVAVVSIIVGVKQIFK